MKISKNIIDIRLVISIISIFVFINSCSKPKVQPRQEAVPVVIEPVIQKEIPIQLSAIGTVQPYASVTVYCQVGGILTQINFKEGQDIKKGDLLFVIDPQPYQATLNQAEASLMRDTAQRIQAEANLARDSAQMENANTELKRYAELIQAGVVTQEEYDQIKTNAKSLVATVAADRAAIKTTEASMQVDRAVYDNARIQLGYCYIRSPMDGRIGSKLIDLGTALKSNDKGLLVINQLSPIYVFFTVPEQELAQVKKYMALRKLLVDAIISNEQNHKVTGELSFLDNAVDVASGTILLKGTFANRDRSLWPGQFVNVVLTLTTEPNSIVVPTEAVQTGQQGQYVFIVKPDNTVETRPVVVKYTYEHETVIQQGLQLGEKVVTDGQLKLSPGAKVEVKPAI
jgi:membrane fusion protein, multidrug efflux system